MSCRSWILPLLISVAHPIAVPSVSAAPGLTERPPNATCVAPPRPGAGSHVAVDLEEVLQPTWRWYSPVVVLHAPQDPAAFYVAELSGIAYRVHSAGGVETRTTLLDIEDRAYDYLETGLNRLSARGHSTWGCSDLISGAGNASTFGNARFRSKATLVGCSIAH